MPCRCLTHVLREAVSPDSELEPADDVDQRRRWHVSMNCTLVDTRWMWLVEHSSSREASKKLLAIAGKLAVEVVLHKETALYLYDRLWDSQKVLTNSQLESMRRKFGQEADRKTIEEVRTIVQDIGSSNVFEGFTAADDHVQESLFGVKIRFHFDLSNTELEDARGSAGVFRLGSIRDVIQMDIIDQQQAEAYAVRYDLNWLRTRLINCVGTDAMDDIFKSVLEYALTSDPVSMEEMLLQLLGYDKINFVSDLVMHKDEFVNNVLTDTKTQQLDNLLSSRGKSECLVPSLVTVKSYEEIQVKKKLEKDLKRRQKSKKEYGVSDDLDDIQRVICAQRVRELRIAADSKSVLKTPAPEIPNYPYVFDRHLEKNLLSSVMARNKVMLPEDAEKNDFGSYVITYIPAETEQSAGLASFNRVRVSSMDECGRAIFKGIETLNLIQSVVYETAYGRGENLLICAPTGAGKTNIAMLTVGYELKRNIVDGVLQKDSFKIVYIAPMKALAAEMTENFGKRLSCMGVSVKELTGDMQLTKREIASTQMLITTPEKWDVVTRKATADDQLLTLVNLLIIDEIHLLHDDRGPVIESLVARSLRYAEQVQSRLRIVGLSATLPNYVDVGRFLRVNPYTGLFFFDSRFRPIPLSQSFVGVKGHSRMDIAENMDWACFNEVKKEIRKKKQVLVFVHARNGTVKTANILLENLRRDTEMHSFNEGFSVDKKSLHRLKSKELERLIPHGLAVHHAGMARSDRTFVEQLFKKGSVRILVCTATLAWGVNLPAHCVIIKGTSIYDAKQSSFVDIGILDVLQIFGRAGRPQFDSSGHGVIITEQVKVDHYMRLMFRQYPIESKLHQSVVDMLNAEIVLGTVTSVDEGIKWLADTYFYVRLLKNPLAYGLRDTDFEDDPTLEKYRRLLITETAKRLCSRYMVRYDENTGFLDPTERGRVASHFYITYKTVGVINDELHPAMNEGELLSLVSKASEFEQLKVRDEEVAEIELLYEEECQFLVPGGFETSHGKANILMQSSISGVPLQAFSLQSDMNYVSQNSVRIARALFRMEFADNKPLLAGRCLTLCRMLERRMWPRSNPLRQINRLSEEDMIRIESKNLSFERIKDLSAKELGNIVHNMKLAHLMKECCSNLPSLHVDAQCQPITRSVLRVTVTITPEFRWSDSIHGTFGEIYWLWVEDPQTDSMYYSQQVVINKKTVITTTEEPVVLVFAIPISEPLPSQYIIRCMSDRWIGSDTSFALSFQNLILPDRHPPHTDLLDLDPLPVRVLGNENYQKFYSFPFFNPIQTQIFHSLYHTDCNVLLGAPTGSGKTAAAEIAIFRLFNEHLTGGAKVVYIAPLKALVRERIAEWKPKFLEFLGKSVVELTGDYTPDIRALENADVIISTPEKWDGISRSWNTRSYVRKVQLIIIDEIHLLGEDRGPVLEVIVSRANYIAAHTASQIRVVGLSTAIANAVDLADWLSIRKVGLYNFRPSVRPVPLSAHIKGYPGEHYCPRMASMNKPCFQAIRTYSTDKPVLVFVSSRRQTRLTAFDLISYLAADDCPKQWLHMPESEMDSIISTIRDSNLQLTLAFGIGMHHAGLTEKDRKMTEELFVNQRIQVLIATSTLAWGVNFPAHLVVIKGTEYFDGKSRSYVDFPITDVLQMMGRAGRPQFDNEGIAVIMVKDTKKDFYKRFLYEPFPVESSLLKVLSDHMNAEIVASTVTNKQQAVDYMTWTYFFRRLLVNPSYYGLDEVQNDHLNEYLSELIEKTLSDLVSSSCIEIDGEQMDEIFPTSYGRIASYYYITHLTVRYFKLEISANMSVAQVLKLLSDANEFDELPVRHNEDTICADLAKKVSLPVVSPDFDSPHTKTFLLLQAHLDHLTMPISDFSTDLKSVLDQLPRVSQALLDMIAENGYLSSVLRTIHVMQMIECKQWIHHSSMLTISELPAEAVSVFTSLGSDNGGPIRSLPELIDRFAGFRRQFMEVMAQPCLVHSNVSKIYEELCAFPVLELDFSILTTKGESKIKVEPWDSMYGRKPVTVERGQNYAMEVNLTRMNQEKGRFGRATDGRRMAEEGWIAIIGDPERNELMALRRISRSRRSFFSSRLSFDLPSCLRAGDSFRLVFYLMSTCYIGLDQQFEFNLNLV